MFETAAFTADAPAKYYKLPGSIADTFAKRKEITADTDDPFAKYFTAAAKSANYTENPYNHHGITVLL